jgi:putative ABC transport system permease protein
LLHGNPKKPFNTDNSVIITASTAKRYFGNEDPIGKILIADNKQNFLVDGVMEDFAENSSIRYDILFPISILEKRYNATDYWKSLDTDWGNYDFYTFLQLPAGINQGHVEKMLTDSHKKVQPQVTTTYSLQELSKIHLYQPDGNDAAMMAVNIFLAIAVLILAIACINYINLSTARSLLRSKEVSVRKILGAEKRQLFFQFIIETALTFVFVSILATGLIYLLLPVYNNLSGKNLSFNFFDLNIWKIIGTTICLTLFASGIYPALLLSSFEPLKALKGKISLGLANVMFRKILVVAQFVFSAALIISTIIISRQMNYIKTKALGYDKEHVLSLPMNDMQQHYAAVKSELLSQSAVKGVTSSQGNIVQVQSMTGDTEWDGKELNRLFLIHPISIDEGFIPFFKINLAEGVSFTGAVSDSSHFILNETAVREAGIKDPIGKRFKLWRTEGTIVGVAKDFHLTTLRQKIQPAIFYYKASNPTLYIKTTGKDEQQAIAAVEKVWKKFNPGYPFQYTFLDQTYNELYKTEQRTGFLYNIFSSVAILISCLGLLGLATYTAQVKTKEIGIRKVLGASVAGIVQLIAKDFILLVAISIVIAAPIAGWLMNSWLQEFTYRIDIEWWIFLIAGIISVAIALITISTQAIKAAIANPVKSLRTE